MTIKNFFSRLLKEGSRNILNKVSNVLPNYYINASNIASKYLPEKMVNKGLNLLIEKTLSLPGVVDHLIDEGMTVAENNINQFVEDKKHKLLQNIENKAYHVIQKQQNPTFGISTLGSSPSNLNSKDISPAFVGDIQPGIIQSDIKKISLSKTVPKQQVVKKVVLPKTKIRNYKVVI